MRTNPGEGTFDVVAVEIAVAPGILDRSQHHSQLRSGAIAEVEELLAAQNRLDRRSRRDIRAVVLLGLLRKGEIGVAPEAIGVTEGEQIFEVLLIEETAPARRARSARTSFRARCIRWWSSQLSVACTASRRVSSMRSVSSRQRSWCSWAAARALSRARSSGVRGATASTATRSAREAVGSFSSSSSSCSRLASLS